MVMTGARIGAATSIDSHSAIGEYANLGRGVQVGIRVMIGHGARIGEWSLIGSCSRLDEGVVLAPHVQLGNEVQICCEAVIGQATRIGAGAQIGAGACVNCCLSFGPIGRCGRLLHYFPESELFSTGCFYGTEYELREKSLKVHGAGTQHHLMYKAAIDGLKAAGDGWLSGKKVRDVEP
jgi:hypothetical protein